MANYKDRQKTLTRLSKFAKDSLTRSSKSDPVSSNYSSAIAASSTIPKYTSELEAKYVGHKSDTSSRYASVGSQLPQRSHTLTSHQYKTDSGKVSSGSRHKKHSRSSERTEHNQDESKAVSETEARYLSSRDKTTVISETEARYQSSLKTMVVSKTEARYLNSSNSLQVIEDKYLHSIAPAPWLPSSDTAAAPCLPSSDTQPLDSSVADLTHSVSEPEPSIVTRNPPKLSESYSQRKPSSTSQSVKEKPNKYSWRPSLETRSSHKLPTGSVTRKRSRKRTASESSSSSKHQTPDDNRSRYRIDKRTASAPTHAKHRHSIDRRRPSSSHAAPGSSKSTSDKSVDVCKSSHNSSKPKPVPAKSSMHSTTEAKYATQFGSHRIDRRGKTSYFSSQGHGFVKPRPHEYSRSRSTSYISSRDHALYSRRGWGSLTLRGRGVRGYSAASYRGRASFSRGARLYRGHGSAGHGSPHTSSWRDVHRTTSFRQGSASKLSSGGSFHSRYALRTSRELPRSSLNFMERRRQAMFNKSPALVRSKFNLVRSHRSLGRSSSSIASPVLSSHVGSDRRLLTVRNTRNKLIRRKEGDGRPIRSLVNLHGDRYKLRINRFSKTLHQIPQDTWTLTSSRSSAGHYKTSYDATRRGDTRIAVKSAAPSLTRRAASHVLQRSIHISLAAKQRSERRSSGKKYCMFYNLYGQCKKGKSCDFIHDPEKVAVCTRFLRGTCPKTDASCLFSHKVSKEKMPVCSYFLRGVCNRDNCPFSHVKVSGSATVCPDFIKGYCPLGDKCKKKHILRCAEFSKTGKCENRKRCTQLHKRDSNSNSSKNDDKRKTSSKHRIQTPRHESRTQAKRTKTNDDIANTPSFIRLSANTPDEQRASSMPDSGEAGSIIPSFLRFSSDQTMKSTSVDTAKSKHKTHGRKKGKTHSKTSSRKRTSRDVPESTFDESQRSLERSPKPSGPRGVTAQSPVGGRGQDGPSLAPLSPVISIIGDMPSFIELWSEETPAETVEESPQQESDQRTLQIRPQFSRNLTL